MIPATQQALDSVQEASGELPQAGNASPLGAGEAPSQDAFPPVINAVDLLREELAPPAPIVEGLLDRCMKGIVIGPSKARKTWFALQLAICIATGRPFLKWPTVKHGVLYLDLEVDKAFLRKRLQSICKAMEITHDDLGDLDIVNARGHDLCLDSDPRNVDRLINLIKKKGYGVVFIDPFYKVLAGDENFAKDVKVVLRAFDRICTSTKAALVYVHHDAKGKPGERAKIDRGAGSNVIQRDMDAAFYLTPQHRPGKTQIVCGVTLRNYPPVDDLVVECEKCAFTVSEAAPTPPGNGHRPKLGNNDALRLIGDTVRTMAETVQLLRDGDFTDRRAKAVIAELERQGTLARHQGGSSRTVYIGLPLAVASFKAEQEKSRT